jgi:hypothetical protein
MADCAPVSPQQHGEAVVKQSTLAVADRFGRPLSILRHLPLDKWLPVVVYVMFAFAGVTTSSIGYEALRANPNHLSSPQFGVARYLRSDEYLEATPLQLGVIAAGNTKYETPLAQQSDLIGQLPSGGLAESVVFFDGSVLRLGPVLPDQMLFAAYWWLPTLLLVLALPGWLRRLGATNRMAWFATALVLLNPANAWWSMFPVRCLAFTVAGCSLLMIARDKFQARSWASGAALAVVGGVLLCRMPTFYVPWSITLGVPIVLTTLVWLLWTPGLRKAALVALGVGGAVTVALLAGLMLENLAALKAGLNTVYPGLRRATGKRQPPALLFGSPGLFVLQADPTMSKGTNASEISTAFTFCLVWAAVIWARLPRLRNANTAAITTLAACTAAWFSWTLFNWGGLGLNLPLANRVPPARAAQTVGFLAILVVCLSLSRLQRPFAPKPPVLAAVACAAVTGYGVSNLSHFTAHPLGSSAISTAIAGVSVVVYFITRYPDRWLPVVAAIALAGASVAYANPILFGLGDLRNSEPARQMLEAGKQARAHHEYWASDNERTDALLVAAGVPSLTGYQVTGPVEDQWRKLDPTERFKTVWNHGASRIQMSWVINAAPTMRNPSPDRIAVSINPCQLHNMGFNLTHIVSSNKLREACLGLQSSFTWGQGTRYVYLVNGS